MILKRFRLERANLLKKKRQSLTPESVGLARGRSRKTPGLRREEVAELANISCEWYIRLEQGREIQASISVLKKLAEVLQFTAHEKEYLLEISGYKIFEPPISLPPEELNNLLLPLQDFLDTQKYYPIIITDMRATIIAWNAAAKLLFGPLEKKTKLERNGLYMLYFDENYKNAQLNWEQHAIEAVGLIKSTCRGLQDDPEFSKILNILIEKSPLFASLWESKIVVPSCLKKVKHFCSKELGPLSFSYLDFNYDLPNYGCIYMFIFIPLQGTDTLAKIKAWDKKFSN